MGLKADMAAQTANAFGNLSSGLNNASSALMDIKNAYNKSSLQQLLAYQNSIYFNSDPQNPENEGYVQQLARTYDQDEFDTLEQQYLQKMYDKMDELKVDKEVRRMWEQNYMPDFKLSLNQAKQDAYVDNYAKKTAILWEDFITTTGADSRRQYAEKVSDLKRYWTDNGVESVGQYVGENSYTKLDKAIEQMQQVSVVQYVDGLYAKNPDLELNASAIADNTIKYLKDQGAQFDADTEFTLRAAALNQAQKHEQMLQKQATEAQTRITTEFQGKSVRHEDYDADDVIQAAIAEGAMVDGKVSRYWIAFMEPYLELSDAKHAQEEALAKYNADAEAAASVTLEEIMGTAKALGNGTFTFQPSTVYDGKTTTKTSSAGKIPIPAQSTVKTGAPVLSKPDGVQGTGLKVTENVEVTPQGEILVEGEEIPARVVESASGTIYAVSDKPIEGLEDYILFTPDEDAAEKKDAAQKEIARNKALERNYVMEEIEGAQPSSLSDKPVSVGNQSYVYDLTKGWESKEAFVEDYTPYAGSENEELSDIALEALELSKMTEGTDFPNMFNEDGDLNFSNSQGKYTYKYTGMPDVDTNYAPLVKAMCQIKGITYDTDSYAVYLMAQTVKELEDSGAFTDRDKAKAVQDLAVMRLNPNKTPEEYNAQLMFYKSSGTLTDEEIDEYGLKSHAFAGDLKDTSYNDSLKNAYGKAFQALFGKAYSTSNENKINEDPQKADQWFRLQRDLERELTLAYQTDPVGTAKDPVSKVDEIVTKLTDKTFSEDLLDAILSSHATLGSWLTSTSNRIQLGDNATVSDILADFFKDPDKYSEYYNPDRLKLSEETRTNPDGTTETYTPTLMEFVNNSYYSPTLNNANNGIGKGNAKAQIEELSREFFGKDYKELTIPEKNELLFTYAYARTRMELTRATCMTFGYGLDEVYGNVTVPASGGFGGGMAVVTNDGRVYMSSSDPDGSGHGWMIGSVSERTLENIKKGATTISFQELSANGVKTFNDQNYTFDKSGVTLTRQRTLADEIYGGTGGLIDLRGNQGKKDADKGIELTDIYSSVQPDRYDIKDMNKGPRSI